jgi:putative copper export protein
VSDAPTKNGVLSYGGSSRLSRVVNNFVHDMCTGVWFASLLVIWVVASRSAGVSVEAREVLVDAQRAVFWLLVTALLGLAVTGGLRLMYWRQDTPLDDLSAKRGSLLVKHVAFLLVYGIGTALAALVVFR